MSRKLIKKLSRKSLGNKALALWKIIVRKPNTCEICGKYGDQPHHVIGSKNLTLKFDLRNGCLLCRTHHTLGRESAHNDPMWFREWLFVNRTNDYNYLAVKRNEITTNCDYEKIIERLKNEL